MYASFHIVLQTLAGPMLTAMYDGLVNSLNAKLMKETVGVQLATDGWKRKNVNNGIKLQNYMVNFADDPSQFLEVDSTDGEKLDHVQYYHILKAHVIALGERMQSIQKVLGIITDKESAVQKAFGMLEKEYHWLMNLVCQVHADAAAALDKCVADDTTQIVQMYMMCT